MDISGRISVFSALGKKIKQQLQDNDEKLNDAILYAKNGNQWFTEDNIRFSLQSIVGLLDKVTLDNWVSNYNFTPNNRRVGVIMAGNIPLVGFHDFLSILLSGNVAVIKLSSEDQFLLPHIVSVLVEIDKNFSKLIEVVDNRLPKDLDAIIATGSNNSSRYFEFYFGKYPNIIRKNRNSIAVITGNETTEELKLLGEDVFRYFGLGCRNVSKIYLPTSYKVDVVFEALFEYNWVLNHNKYANNYTYQRALLLMDSAKFYDNNFLVMKEDKSIVSSIGVLNFEYYDNILNVEDNLNKLEDKIQCVVCKDPTFKFTRRIDLGESQIPAIDDYADGVNTLSFLANLN